MSPTPEPRPGHYTDSCRTVYEATRKGKPPQWHLQRLIGWDGHCYTDQPFAADHFPQAVQRGTFQLIPETK
jgi:hypothetical protein